MSIRDQENVFHTFITEDSEEDPKELDYIPIKSKYRAVTEGLNQIYEEIMEELGKGGSK